ncbi:hypothetical protein [Aquimarina rhabdastrellae]
MKRIDLYIIIFLLVSCNSNEYTSLNDINLPELNAKETKDYRIEGKYINGYKNDKWNYFNDNNHSIIHWGLYEKQELKINIPKSWLIKEDSKYYFYALPEKKDDDFFLINRIKEDNINLKNFFDQAIHKLLDGNTIKITNKLFFKIEYENNEKYYLRFDTNEDSYYMVYLEYNGYIYDITYRTKNKERDINKHIFSGILFSLTISDSKLIGNQKKLKITRLSL